MKKSLIAALAVTMVLPAVTPAFAAPNDHRGQGQQSQRWDNDRDGRGDRNGRAQRGPHGRWKATAYRRPSGYQARRWNRGERLPPAYRSSGYYVDYRQYGYRAPPRGYQYVRVDNDVVLVAIATGVISSILLNQFE